jgi:hypothetical protein
MLRPGAGAGHEQARARALGAACKPVPKPGCCVQAAVQQQVHRPGRSMLDDAAKHLLVHLFPKVPSVLGRQPVQQLRAVLRNELGNGRDRRAQAPAPQRYSSTSVRLRRTIASTSACLSGGVTKVSLVFPRIRQPTSLLDVSKSPSASSSQTSVDAANRAPFRWRSSTGSSDSKRSSRSTSRPNCQTASALLVDGRALQGDAAF